MKTLLQCYVQYTLSGLPQNNHAFLQALLSCIKIIIVTSLLLNISFTLYLKHAVCQSGPKQIERNSLEVKYWKSCTQTQILNIINIMWKPGDVSIIAILRSVNEVQSQQHSWAKYLKKVKKCSKIDIFFWAFFDCYWQSLVFEKDIALH